MKKNKWTEPIQNTRRQRRLVVRINCCTLRCSLVTKEPHRERWICEQIDKGWECDWVDVTRSLYEGSLFVREVSVSVNSHISISRFHWSLVAAPTHSLHSFRCRARLIRFFPRFFYDSALIAFNLCEFYLMSLLSTVRLFTTAVVALFLLLARLCLGSQSDN